MRVVERAKRTSNVQIQTLVLISEVLEVLVGLVVEARRLLFDI